MPAGANPCPLLKLRGNLAITPRALVGFQDRRLRPLGHPSDFSNYDSLAGLKPRPTFSSGAASASDGAGNRAERFSEQPDGVA